MDFGELWTETLSGMCLLFSMKNKNAKDLACCYWLEWTKWNKSIERNVLLEDGIRTTENQTRDITSESWISRYKLMLKKL